MSGWGEPTRLKDLSPFEAQKRLDQLHSVSEKLIGLQMAPQSYSVSGMAQPGVKVALSTQGEAELCNDPLGPSTVRNKPGYITHVHEAGDAVMVKWDTMEGDCGWYRIGAYGCYYLKSHDLGNSDDEINQRIYHIQANSTDADMAVHTTHAGDL